MNLVDNRDYVKAVRPFFNAASGLYEREWFIVEWRDYSTTTIEPVEALGECRGLVERALVSVGFK